MNPLRTIARQAKEKRAASDEFDRQLHIDKISPGGRRSKDIELPSMGALKRETEPPKAFKEMQEFDRKNRHLSHDDYWRKRLAGK